MYQESIIDHFGNYSKYLQQFAAPGHWHDPDMLLIGNDCINNDEARSQMAIWVRCLCFYCCFGCVIDVDVDACR